MQITEILSQYRIPFVVGGQHRNVREGWIGIDCPKCGRGSGGYYLGIHDENKFATCWHCGPVKLGEILHELTGEPWHVVIDWLKTPLDALRRPSKRSDRADHVTTPSGLKTLKQGHITYLHNRGFDPLEITRLWNIQSTSHYGPLAHRIWIPCYMDGRLVSWTTRATNTKQLRYMSADPHKETVAKSERLYGQDYVRNAVVVCEGPTDVWAIGPGAVATLGLGCSQWQLAWLSKIPIRVICFDSEPLAQRRAKRVADELSLFPGTTHVVQLETGSDPAAADKSEINELQKTFL